MRVLSPYEQNHLRRHGIDPETVEKYGEMPVEYITGFAEFCGRDFVVNHHVMTPRTETEEVVRIALAELSARRTTNDERRIIRLADVGTGCGCLGITLFLELKARGMKPEAYLSDVSKDALEVAKENMRRLIEDRDRDRDRENIHFLQSDLFEHFPKDVKFDLIVANLPYILSSRIPKLQPSVRDYEPHFALDGGKDGLSVIRKFITQAPQYLKKNGFIIVEVDESHQPEQLKQSYSIAVHKDQFGKSRYFVLRRL